jgi:hypothetical protein
MSLLVDNFSYLNSLIDDTTYQTFRIKNNSEQTDIVDMKFHKNIYYNVSGPKKINLNPNEEYNIIIGYCPKYENQFDIDTLDILTNCSNIKYSINLSGFGVKPKIKVEDVDFGFVRIGEITKLSAVRGNDSAITISNPGSSFLEISNYRLLNGKYFAISSPHDPELKGYMVYPRDSVRFKSLQLFAGVPGRITDTLVISSNAKGPDSISVLTAYAVYPGAYLSEYNFIDRRLFESDSGEVLIQNNSDKPFKIAGIIVTGDTNDIKVQYSKISPVFQKNNFLTLYPEIFDSTKFLTRIKIPVKFRPLSEYVKRIKISLKFANEDTSSIEVFNFISGRGIIPKVLAEGIDFQPEILAGTKYPGLKYIRITNPSTTSDMKLYKVTRLDSSFFGSNYFTFPQGLPSNITIAKGQTISIPVEFYPMTNGNMKLMVKISTNCNLTNQPEYLTDTMVTITGSSYKTPVRIEHTIIPKINKCSSAIITITMTNLNASESVKIDSLKILSNEANTFELVDNSLSNGFILGAKEVFKFDILYNPSASIQTLNRADLIYYIGDREFGSEIFADCFISKISVTLDTLYYIIPGYSLNSKTTKSHNYWIKIRSDNFTGTTADSFQLKLSYNPSNLEFMDYISGNNGMESWTFTTKTKNIGFEETELSIIGHSTTPQTTFEGNIYPAFMTMLSDSSVISIKAKELKINDNSTCFTPYLGIGKISMNLCEMQIGKLIFSDYRYNMITIVPNPVIGDEVTIRFSVAFRTLTSIELYNTAGKLIYTLLNKYLEADDYEMQFSLKDVPAGTYLVKFKSGIFTTSQQIIVIK